MPATSPFEIGTWVVCAPRGAGRGDIMYGAVTAFEPSRVRVAWEPWRRFSLNEAWISSDAIKPSGTLAVSLRDLTKGDRVYHFVREKRGVVKWVDSQMGLASVLFDHDAYGHPIECDLENLYMSQHLEGIEP